MSRTSTEAAKISEALRVSLDIIDGASNAFTELARDTSPETTIQSSDALDNPCLPSKWQGHKHICVLGIFVNIVRLLWNF
jgi:hypothetical protein